MSKPAQKTRNVVLDWSEIKHKFMKCVADGEAWASQSPMRFLKRLGADPNAEDRWQGGSGADTLGWLREGFSAPEFAHSAEYVPEGRKRRPTWNEEEGDVDAGRLYGGYDSFYLDTQMRESKPGLRVQVEFCFAAGCDVHILREYGAWVAGLIGSLESSGYDLTVDLWIPLNGLFASNPHERVNTLIRVKKPNEVSDFTEWSALFAPTGFRHLGFVALGLAADKCKERAVSTLGITISGKTWNVEYEREEGVVNISVNQQAYKGEKFPAEHLNQRAKEAGLI